MLSANLADRPLSYGMRILICIALCSKSISLKERLFASFFFSRKQVGYNRVR